MKNNTLTEELAVPSYPQSSVFEHVKQKHETLLHNSLVKDYINNFCVATLLELNKKFENYNSELYGRIKSPYAVDDRCFNSEKYRKAYIKGRNLKREFSKDLFAFKIVGPKNRKLLNYDNYLDNENVVKLLNKANSDNDFYKKTIETSKNISSIDEYSNTYFTVLERINNLLPKEAKKLSVKYYGSIKDSFIKAKSQAKDLEDLERIINSNPNLPTLTDLLSNDFSKYIYNRLNLEILSKEAISIFQNSELMKAFHVSISSVQTKARPNGYVATYLLLQTPLGIVECQVQSFNDYLDGAFGFSAHNSNMDGKNGIPLVELPKTEKEKKSFLKRISYLSPTYYSVKNIYPKLSSGSENESTISIYTNSTYNNYKKVISEVPKGSDKEKEVAEYIDDIDSIFSEQKYREREALHFSTPSLDIKKYIQKGLPKFLEYTEKFNNNVDQNNSIHNDAFVK